MEWAQKYGYIDNMTEKRFYLMNVEDPFHEYGRWCKPVLEDGETEKQYENALEVMDLLNKLHEEKEIAIDGIKIADELIKKYGSEELKHEWKKEVTVKYR